ncbi:prolyl oligopeptidase family serine peptidase [Massilia sp. CFBP9026]|uniref:prolyl oligopeptidase family serine peptidase n=1 Tax=Massilia sp. CFBP9026 TaxID=3096536 RepID=UPI002A6991EE|nr:prolyl oligopeptidase family serine peptidase [Massilia sp. CFBP9026]MDY0962976.1 prolyl oligopeptidase family serine peptidase [Massilia sp. CFBP9026]
MHPTAYPITRRTDAVDILHGQRIDDPYRWLEGDARSDAEVAAWIAAQNVVTNACLAELPGRAVFRARLEALQNHEKFTIPREQGGRYFYTRNPGLENQATLLVRDSVDGPDRVLIDPNTWSDHGTRALAEWAPSKDGALLAYAVQEDGADWRTIKVIEVATGKILDDALAWARFTTIAWASDGAGFFYTRYPEATAGDAALANHAVYFHALNTPQSSDRLLYATPERPELLHFVEVTDSGRYAVITSTPGTQTNNLVVIDLHDERWQPRTVVKGFDAEWSPVGDAGSTLYLLTSGRAERRRIATLDLADPGAAPRDLIAEDSAVLGDARLVGGRLIGTYLVDVKTQLRRFTLDGRPDGVVALPGIGSAGGFQGHQADNEAFFVFTSFNAPTTIYRYDVAANTASVWAAPTVDADLDNIVVEQRFYAARDGARVPLFLVRRSDIAGPAPTLLHGYGGFGISMISYYEPNLLAWIEHGGIVAIANIRGGGEYGKAWHEAARLDRKQTSYDDFIAAAEYLHAQGIVTRDGLAVHGESGGGLLVGAVVNQRPELFAAALPGVGVMDMLRFHRFTGGRLWMGEFGDPDDAAQFRTLLSYSPYHNVAAGKPYPAILVTTADTDDRVVPAHSFKYVAALQNIDAGPRPHLVRIETQAGHGAGKPTAKAIAEMADKWAFAAVWTGLRVE